MPTAQSVEPDAPVVIDVMRKPELRVTVLHVEPL